MALKDITRQLQLENVVGDTVFVSGGRFRGGGGSAKSAMNLKGSLFAGQFCGEPGVSAGGPEER